MNTHEQTTKNNNVQTIEDIIRDINNGDLESAGNKVSEYITYIDHSMNTTFHGRDEWLQLLRIRRGAYSDVQIGNFEFIDAGDTVVITSRIHGTNDGQIGPFSPGGKRAEFPVCEIWRFDDDGVPVSDEIFYDTLTILSQLGHIEFPTGG